MVKVSLKADQ